MIIPTVFFHAERNSHVARERKGKKERGKTRAGEKKNFFQQYMRNIKTAHIHEKKKGFKKVEFIFRKTIPRM